MLTQRQGRLKLKGGTVGQNILFWNLDCTHLIEWQASSDAFLHVTPQELPDLD